MVISMKKQNNEQYEMLLEVSKKDISDYVLISKQIKNIEKHLRNIENNLLIRMKTSELETLGDIKLVKVPTLKEIEIGKILDYVLNKELAKAIVVKIDIEKTIKNLKETYGFAKSITTPLVKMLEENLGVFEERLELNDNTISK